MIMRNKSLFMMMCSS